MTKDDAFFDELTIINADMEAAAERLGQVRENVGGVPIVRAEDHETIEALAQMQAAQKRFSDLMANVERNG